MIFGRRRFQSPGFTVELTGISLEARQVCVGIGRCLHCVLLIQRVSGFQERAGVLCHDVGRVAIRPTRVQQRRVAVRECKSLRGEFMRRAHDVDIEARCVAQALSVEAFQAFQPLRDALGDLLLSGRRAVLELALEADAGLSLSMPRLVAVSG